MHYSGPKVKVYKVWPNHIQEGLIQNQQTKPNKIKSTKIYESTSKAKEQSKHIHNLLEVVALAPPHHHQFATASTTMIQIKRPKSKS